MMVNAGIVPKWKNEKLKLKWKLMFPNEIYHDAKKPKQTKSTARNDEARSGSEDSTHTNELDFGMGATGMSDGIVYGDMTFDFSNPWLHSHL